MKSSTSALRRAVPIVLVALAVTAVGASRPAQRSDLRTLPTAETLPASEPATAREPAPGSSVLQLDDGSFETAVGVGNANSGNQAVYLNRFTVAPDMPFTIDTVSILLPATNAGTTTGVLEGQDFDVLVYVDPDGTGDPANAQFKARKPFLASPSNTTFQDVQLDLPIVVFSGDVWVGFTNTVTSQDNRPMFPGAVDFPNADASRSWVFFNTDPGSHFPGGGALTDAEVGVTLDQTNAPGVLMIRARGQAGGLTCVTWESPASLRGDGLPPPLNTHICDTVPPPIDPSLRAPRAVLQGYNVYRSNQPGVQPTPQNFFTSVPPTQTAVGSSVSPTGSFFVVTAQYDTGESGPSNELAVVPPTVTKLKVTDTKIAARGRDFTTAIQLFLDGVPFSTQATLKQNGARFIQRGTLLTGQTIGQYLAANGNKARIDIRNARGAILTINFSR